MRAYLLRYSYSIQTRRRLPGRAWGYHESWSFREAIILVKGDLILAAFPCALVSPYPDPLTTKIAARSIANGCRNFGETAAVPALRVSTDEEGGHHVHLWRLSGTYGFRDVTRLTLAPPPVLPDLCPRAR